MTLTCLINLYKPDYIYKPGDTVVGAILYTLRKPMEFEKITISLKGAARLKVKIKSSNSEETYKAVEDHVDIEQVVTNTNVQVPAGSYMLRFNFQLPDNMPQTLEYKKMTCGSGIKCNIKYNIRIKFERPGLFDFNKIFKKEIHMESLITPTLPIEPAVYEKSKKLMRLFSRKNATVNLKVTIENSVIPTGGTILLNCELTNNSNVATKGVKSKVDEKYVFNANSYRKFKEKTKVSGTDGITERFEADSTICWPVAIDLPLDRTTLMNSQIVKRDYIIRMTVKLPMPHRNFELKIPVEVGMLPANNNLECKPPSAVPYGDPPAELWRPMPEV